jgi:hypothetical protein
MHPGSVEKASRAKKTHGDYRSVTLLQRDVDKLEPDTYLSDSNIDFWIKG